MFGAWSRKRERGVNCNRGEESMEKGRRALKEWIEEEDQGCQDCDHILVGLKRGEKKRVSKRRTDDPNNNPKLPEAGRLWVPGRCVHGCRGKKGVSFYIQGGEPPLARGGTVYRLVARQERRKKRVYVGLENFN